MLLAGSVNWRQIVSISNLILPKQFFLNHFKGGRLIKQKFPYLIFRNPCEPAKLFYRNKSIFRLFVFTNLIPGNYQINLFQDTEEMIKLYQAIDSVKRRFGESMLMRGGGCE
jgi:hypothetical protein